MCLNHRSFYRYRFYTITVLKFTVGLIKQLLFVIPIKAFVAAKRKLTGNFHLSNYTE